MKSIDINLLKWIWQVLASNIGNETMEKICQYINNDIETNQKVSQDLIFVLYKSFYEAQNIILSKCREELIKKSIMTLYRGVITYQPPDNDYDIKNIENKIEFLALQVKEIRQIKPYNRKTLTLNEIEEVFTQLSTLLNYQSFQKTQECLDKLIQEAEKDCDVNIYKTTLRDKEKGLSKVLYDIFLAEIEDNYGLNSIFDAHLLTFKSVNNVRPERSEPYISELELSDGKLFIIPLEPTSMKADTAWKKSEHEAKLLRYIRDNKQSNQVAKEFPPQLPPEQLEEAFYTACGIESELWRVRKLGELAPHLSPKLLEEAFKTVCDLNSELWRSRALSDLAPYLSPKMLKQALKIACDIESELWRAKALGELAPYLTPKMLQQALEAVRSIQSEYSRSRALEDLKPYLSQSND